MEVKTLHFPNNASGQRKKNAALAQELAQGWKIVAETITPGNFRGTDACCLAVLCLPLAFLAGSTDGTINVTLQRETTAPKDSTINLGTTAAPQMAAPHDKGWAPTESDDAMFGFIFGWVGGGLMALTCLGALISGELLSAFLMVLAAFIVLPPTREQIESGYGSKLPGAGLAFAYFVLFSIAMTIAATGNEKKAGTSKNGPPASMKAKPITSSADADITYIEEATGYLATANSESRKVTKALAGAATDSGGLSENLDSISKSLAILHSAFDRRADLFEVGPIRPRFAKINAELKRSHTLRVAAINDILHSSAEKRATQIPQMRDKLARSEVIAQSTAKLLDAEKSKLDNEPDPLEESASGCEVISTPGSMVFTFCPKKMPIDQVAHEVVRIAKEYFNSTQNQVHVHVYNERKRAPRISSDMEKLSDSQEKRVHIAIFDWNRNTNYRDFKCKKYGPSKDWVACDSLISKEAF